MDEVWGRKVARLPDAGALLVATDLQGNLGDYERMVALLDAERARGPAWLAFTGDLVHGPSPELSAPGCWPVHLGTPYVDESAELVRRFEGLAASGAAFSLMGNHEHAHVGGPKVPKFHPDEAAVLDAALGADRERVHAFFRTFPLLAVGSCGVVLTHGAPSRTARTLAAFEALDWEGYRDVPLQRMASRDVLGALLWARSCTDPEALALLEVATGRAEGVVVHGHDVVREGYAREGAHHMVVSTSYALLDGAKVYLRLDLGARYRTTADLREGAEILPLYA
ncbi:MAG: metallophosphoesterase [Myxococcota bacterium]